MSAQKIDVSHAVEHAFTCIYTMHLHHTIHHAFTPYTMHLHTSMHLHHRCTELSLHLISVLKNKASFKFSVFHQISNFWPFDKLIFQFHSAFVSFMLPISYRPTLMISLNPPALQFYHQIWPNRHSISTWIFDNIWINLSY